jgi:hypothetical protein
VKRLVATRSSQMMMLVKAWEGCVRRMVWVRRASVMRSRRFALGVMNDGWRVVEWEEMKGRAELNTEEAAGARTLVSRVGTMGDPK